MKKQNSAEHFLNDSVNCLLKMRSLTQLYPASMSNDDLSNSNCEMRNNNKASDYDCEYEYISPSPSIHIEINKTNSHKNDYNKNLTNNSRFDFLMADIKQDTDYNNNTDKTFKMKYELPNISLLHSPIKTFKPIQIVNFTKK